MPYPAPTLPGRETSCPVCACSVPTCAPAAPAHATTPTVVAATESATPAATATGTTGDVYAGGVPPRLVGAMRSAAFVFLTSQEVPRYEEVQRRAHAFCRDLWRLVPLVEELAGGHGRGHASAEQALAAVRAARRRMNLPERCGLNAEVLRVRGLARSVGSLCDHHDALTGAFAEATADG